MLSSSWSFFGPLGHWSSVDGSSDNASSRCLIALGFGEFRSRVEASGVMHVPQAVPVFLGWGCRTLCPLEGGCCPQGFLLPGETVGTYSAAQFKLLVQVQMQGGIGFNVVAGLYLIASQIISIVSQRLSKIPLNVGHEDMVFYDC